MSVCNKSIELKDDEEISYDYTNQGEILQELLEKKQITDEYKVMINRAIKINPNTKKELELIDLNKENMFNEDEFTRELSKKFNTKERTKMKMCKLDNYCLFIASRYLETVEDHINLVKTCKRMERNMDREKGLLPGIC